jgi:hypothetical protein
VEKGIGVGVSVDMGIGKVGCIGVGVGVSGEQPCIYSLYSPPLVRKVKSVEIIQ